MDFKVASRFVVFWICCVHFSTFAQQDEIASRHYSMKDGLSNDFAQCLLQDSKGFLWVGTYSGLNKFDGYHFTNYRQNTSDPNSLIGDIVRCLWEDDQQRLWIGTEAGLQLFDLTTEKFHHLRTDSLNPAKGFTISTHKIRERKDGKLWICTSQGIYLADPQTLSITKHNFFEYARRDKVLKDSVSDKFFWDIAEAHDGTIWASGVKGLVHIDSHAGLTTRYLHDSGDPKSLASDIARTVYIDSHDRIWVGTNRGLDLFNPQDQSFTHFLPGHLDSLLSDILLAAVLENDDGKFWIGLGHGFYAFDPDTGTFGALVRQSVWAILEDRQGIIWIATYDGLFQITQGKNRFIYNRQFGTDSVSDVIDFAEDKNHQIWIAVRQHGDQLFKHDPSSKKYVQYRNDPLDPYSFSGNGVRAIIPDNDGGVWAASYFKLHKFNSHDQTFINIDIPFQPTTLLKDSRGRIWLGKWDGMEVYDPQNNKLEPLINFPPTEVKYMVEDREENIWIGTNDGLFRYSLKTGQLDVFKHNHANPQSISNNRIEHLMIDQQGAMWLGTHGGLNKLVPGTGKGEAKFNHWQTTNSHLPHDLVVCVIDGGDGTLWMSSGNQISHFFPPSGEFRNYDHSDGLHGRLIYRGQKSHRGEIYFNSGDGLIVFHPDSLLDNPYVPPVAITGFYIRNEPVSVLGSYGDTLSWKTPLTHTISYTDEVSLTFEQNDVAFEFAALNYIKQEKNQYKYKLEPYETDWIETSAGNRIVRYTNLSPGRYTFRVIGSNNDGVWNDKGATLMITITPPWWRTVWAYSVYGIAFVGLLFIGRNVIIQRERLAAKSRLDQLELQKLQEIDKIKTNFFSNISHEFRTPITLILGPLRDLQSKASSEDQKTLFGTMLRNGQRLLRLVNQLLDLSRLEAGKMKLHASQTDLVQTLREIAASYESLAADRKIRYFFYPEKAEVLTYLDPEKIEKVVHNLLANAFKFTSDGGEVILNLKASENHATIVVKDTGIGISANELDKVFDRFYQVDSSQTRGYEGSGLGMALAKELVELHHGTISVESRPGEGSTFTVRLKLGKEHLQKEEILPAHPSGEDSGDYVSTKLDSGELQAVEIAKHQENGKEKTTTPSEQPVLLVVEDNADMRNFIRRTLSDQYQIVEAENGKAGLALAKESVPDLIISDIMMPEMDGYALCERIKSNELTSHIPVILLTAKANRESKLQGLEKGADDYLSKPFDADELKLIVRNRIEERRKMRERFSREVTLEPRQIAITSLDEKFLTKVLAIIEEHMDDEHFSIDELSREAGYSNMHFYRKIKALAGQTPSQFLRTIRLKRAAELLAKNSDNVTQIAYSVGFSSLSYFSKCFKEQFGVTPGQYAEKSFKTEV